MEFNIKSFKANNNLPKCLIDFLNYLEVIKGKSKNTIEGYKLDLTMFFRFLKLYKYGETLKNDIKFEDIEIKDITNSQLNEITLSDLYAFLSFSEKYRKNKSCARARKVASLKSFFKFLSTKAKIIDENVADDLESPKIEKRNPVYLTLNESKLLLKTASNQNKRDFCIITLFLNCGLRISELCNIDISKIKDDTLTVIGKGNKERTVYLNKASLKSLNEYLTYRNEFEEKIKLEFKDALFLNKNYTRISKRGVELIVKKYIKESGLDDKKYTPHKLRHTAATLMYKYGNVDILNLKEILGHSNVSTTQIYTHVDNENLRQAIKSNPLSDE